MFKFSALRFCWAAIHPNPSGVIYFIGGAFFGSFPNIFYRYLLRNLYNQSYTIVAIPYRFTFQHWNISLEIFSDLDKIHNELIYESSNLGYNSQLYKSIKSGNKYNATWLGHSLGCKYIALLELLTELSQNYQDNFLSYFKDKKSKPCISIHEQKKVIYFLKNQGLSNISIKDQKSILLAPAIEGIESAIPIFRDNKFSMLRNLFSRIGINVKPSKNETFCLIESSNLFNLINLISFKKDTRVAASTVNWLTCNIGQRIAKIDIIEGKHLAPLGLNSGDPRIWQSIATILNHDVKPIT